MLNFFNWLGMGFTKIKVIHNCKCAQACFLWNSFWVSADNECKSLLLFHTFLCTKVPISPTLWSLVRVFLHSRQIPFVGHLWFFSSPSAIIPITHHPKHIPVLFITLAVDRYECHFFYLPTLSTWDVNWFPCWKLKASQNCSPENSHSSLRNCSTTPVVIPSDEEANVVWNQ